jgi:hypothetical protein
MAIQRSETNSDEVVILQRYHVKRAFDEFPKTKDEPTFDNFGLLQRHTHEE